MTARDEPTRGVGAAEPTSSRPDAGTDGVDRAAGPVVDPVVDPDGNPGEPRRPLLMDPAGARPSGFAPPMSPIDVASSLPAAGRAADPAAARSPARRPSAGPSAGPSASPWAPGTGARPRPARPHTPSVLAGPTPTGTTADDRPATVESARSDTLFGPVSRVVTISVRTPSSRIDLALPDRTTIAEVLETVLELAPRSLREQALAHGGWILRTVAGRPLPGSTTLLDEGVTGGTTLFLTGADSVEAAVVHDDLADAVADAVRTDTGAWPAGTGRAFALGTCAAFGVLAILAALTLGPPWVVPSLVLAGLAVAGQVVAGLLARRRGDCGTALTVGLLSVVAGSVAATLAVAGSAPLTRLGPVPWLVGTLTAGVLAGTASLAIGSRRVPFGAVISAAGLLAVAGTCSAAFGLGPVGTAALVCGLAVCLMPAVPSLALRLAAFDPDPLPAAPQDLAAATRRTVDGADVRSRTRRAVHLLTALLHGLAWPALAAGIVLALDGALAGATLAAVVGLAMVLRARLFRTVGQRLPLLMCGVGCLLAVPAGVVIHADSTPTVALVIVVSVAAAAVAAMVAGRRTRRTPAMARAAEIGDLLLTIAVIPLVAAVLGAFAFVRGLGG
jgi:type VII secretion integral membrane protein EccD